MKVGVIADDITGANDTGVQFAKRGLQVSVMLEPPAARIEAEQKRDALVLDTDSRSMDAYLAYRRVAEASRSLQALGAKIVFKKIDSTLRGNLGAEIDAVYDVFRPDFVIIAPAYPQAGRLVKDGKLYVHGTPVHETEFANDPRTPITDSCICALLRKQSERPAEILPASILAQRSDELGGMLNRLLSQGIRYLIADSSNDDDLKLLVARIGETGHSVVWAGSAGLASHLPVEESDRSIPDVEIVAPGSPQSVLFVVGSISARSRSQLDILLEREDVQGVSVEGWRLASGHAECERELRRAVKQAEDSLSNRLHPVLYVKADADAVRLAREAGVRNGMNAQETSEAVSRALGTAALSLCGRMQVGAIVMTGGDTAKQICAKLGAVEFRLLDELEPGVPVGLLIADKLIPAVTKAGGFGSDGVFVLALERLMTS